MRQLYLRHQHPIVRVWGVPATLLLMQLLINILQDASKDGLDSCTLSLMLETWTELESCLQSGPGLGQVIAAILGSEPKN